MLRNIVGKLTKQLFLQVTSNIGEKFSSRKTKQSKSFKNRRIIIWSWLMKTLCRYHRQSVLRVLLIEKQIHTSFVDFFLDFTSRQLQLILWYSKPNPMADKKWLVLHRTIIKKTSKSKCVKFTITKVCLSF